MTGRTHDLFAITSVNIVFVHLAAVPSISIATFLTTLTVSAIGGLTPDIDQSTGALWRKIPAGTFWGKLLAPILGGHRFLSHSLLGVVVFGILAKLILGWFGTWILADMNIVWWAFMIGFLSHLVIDTITREGVPWLFPIPFHFGLPPFKFLRIKTGGLIEKFVIFPGLIVANGMMVFLFYSKYKELLKFMIHK